MKSMKDMWFKCNICGHETQSSRDITGEECIAGYDFVADPALLHIRKEIRKRIRKEEPSLVCTKDQEKYIETHGCVPFNFPYYRIPGKYFSIDHDRR